MPRISEQRRERNLQTVFNVIKRHPNGITTTQIAAQAGFKERTLRTYLEELYDEGKIDKEGKHWVIGDFEEVHSLKFDIEPEQAFMYYLGSRLFVKQHDKRNELAEHALHTLADQLSSHRMVSHEIVQAATELAQRPGVPGYEKVFGKIVQAFLRRKELEITYKPLNGEPFETKFKIYLIEPSAIGFATYIIGHSSLPDADRAYKLERIQDAKFSGEKYRIPKEFRGLEILHYAWSIVMGEETTRVVLRFSPNVKERVLETQWHPTQDHDHHGPKPEDDPLLWWIDVEGTMDLEPWLRSWGHDCEVIEPEWLAKKLLEDHEESVNNYRNSLGIRKDTIDTKPEPHLLLWAKADRKTYKIHRLIYHMIDVGQATLALWHNVLHQRLKQQMAQWLKVPVDDAGRLIAFWAALHDLGKASPAFQDHPSLPKKLRSKLRTSSERADLRFPPRVPYHYPHLF